jgi:hypothetical protein
VIQDDITRWLGESRVDGRLAVRVGRRGDELVADFPNLGRLTTSLREDRSEFEPVANLPVELVEKLRKTVIDAYVRHSKGKMTLHGGAVCSESEVIAFVGPSRAGKSTLTAALCAKLGWKIVADDTVAIESSECDSVGIEVFPTQDAAWLLPDSRQILGLDASHLRKTAVSLVPAAPTRASLLAVVGLAFDSGQSVPTLNRLHGQKAFSTISNSTFRFVIDDPAVHLREFEQLRSIVENCPIYELSRARNFDQLAATVELIAEFWLAERRGSANAHA